MALLRLRLTQFISSSNGQLYSFLHNLSEEARGRDNVVLAVSIPASELEKSADDQAVYFRFKKLLDRLGKPVFMSAETEISEIIRRRLFEWDERLVRPDGRVMLTRDCRADLQRVRRLGCRAPHAAAELVPDRSGARCLQGDLSVPRRCCRCSNANGREAEDHWARPALW